MSDALLPPAAEPLAAARERAIRLLTDRYADDSLSTAEFESRLDRLYTTATPVDVETLVADLQVARPLAPVPPMPSAGPAPGWAPERQGQVLPAPRSGGYMQRATRRLLCILGQRTVAGRWTAPEYLELRAVLSEVVLDLREAVFTGDCEIDVMAVLGSVHILLPPDAALETQMGTVLGEIADRGVAGIAPVSGRTAVLVRLTGTSVLSEVAVRRAPPNLPVGVPHKQAWMASRRSAR
jgi:hypothetical protein